MSRSTATLHSTRSVDSTGSDFGITPVIIEMRKSEVIQKGETRLMASEYSPADKWYILMEPGNKVQTFFLIDSCS